MSLDESVNSNPYDPPSLIGAQPPEEYLTATVKRPVGISILAALHFVGGIVSFAVPFVLFADLRSVTASLRSIGVAPAVLVLTMFLLAAIAIASGFGMWKGVRWGWWLAAFYYVYGIFRYGFALVMIIAMAGRVVGGAGSLVLVFLKPAVRCIIHSSLLYYLFKSNVLEYFGLRELSKRRAIGILVGVCLAVGAFTSIVSLLVV